MSPDEAKEAYRKAWGAYCLTGLNLEKKQMLEELMDDLQPKICRGPGPEWDAFVQTLPGFLEYWARWQETVMKLVLARVQPD